MTHPGGATMLGEILLFKDNGLEFLFRWGHVLVGITWIGLLYFFNFVQAPAFAAMDAGARNNAMDKLTWRALWWFRWAALMTFLTGLVLVYFITKDTTGFFKSARGVSISIGMLFGTVMFLNVWGIIWRKQKIVIANARNVQAGGEADPLAPPAGRLALMASRQNTIFSFPMLLLMVGSSHFFSISGSAASDNRMGFLGISALIILVLELNALGVMPWKTAPGKGLNWMYESHKNAIISGLVLTVIVVAVGEGFLLH